MVLVCAKRVVWTLTQMIFQLFTFVGNMEYSHLKKYQIFNDQDLMLFFSKTLKFNDFILRE
jgi:hypothetical protein